MELRELKQQVSIVQVAEALGYIYNPRKGRNKKTGLVFEKHMRRGGVETVDKVVINRINEAGHEELYFNQDRGLGFTDRGSVIDFVHNRLWMFGRSGGLQEAAKVLHGFTGERFEKRDWEQRHEIGSKTPVFDPGQYTEAVPSLADLEYLSGERLISKEALKTFQPFIKMVSYKKWMEGNRNIGFPYQLPAGETCGYELKNPGFKMHAEGTNKSMGVWTATLAAEPGLVREVYLFESGIDAMSYYDLNDRKADLERCALVSLGGQITAGQLDGIKGRFPNALPVGCFDNDRAGNLMDIYAACSFSGKAFGLKAKKDGLEVHLAGKDLSMAFDGDISLKTFYKESGWRNFKYRTKKPPIGTKDWNEALMLSRQDRARTFKR